MDCSACLRTTASHVARVCGAMDRDALRSIFVQLYGHPYCKSKAHLFERAYARQPRPLEMVVTAA